MGFAVLLVAIPAHAEELSVDAVKEAGLSFNAGREAFDSEEYEAAAEHFERADELAADATALSNAISARLKADQFSRAATLAALALSRYPDDEQLQASAGELVTRAKAELLTVNIECEQPCTVLVGKRLVHGEPAASRVVFLAPGRHDLRAAFEGKHGDSKTANGGAGAEVELYFKPFREEASGPALLPDTSGADNASSDGFGSDDSWTDPYDEGPGDQAESSGGLPPGVFWTGLALTGVLGGVSAWSAFDTVNNPGKEAVEEACRGKGEDCPEYVDGQNKETRTNILWGATAGVGLTTVIIGLALTDWGGADEDSEAARRRQIARHGTGVSPWFDVSYTGASLGARGRF